jgi:hypothetical protein
MRAASNPGAKTKTVLWLSIGGALLLFAAANWHLVYVSITSQPDCVPHVRQGENASSGQFQAAKSACRPQ